MIRKLGNLIKEIKVSVNLKRLGRGLKNIGQKTACFFYFRLTLRLEKDWYEVRQSQPI